MSSLKKESKNRLMLLDILRAVASISVVFFHLNEPLPDDGSFYKNMVSFGWLGVPVFFVISGYCIWMISMKIKNPFEFILKRIMRIYLPYLFSLIVVLGVVGVHWLSYSVNDVTKLPADINSIVLTLLLMTDPATSVHTINWVYWSLTYEVVFYIIIFLVLFTQYRLPIISFLSIASIIPTIENIPMLFFLNNFSIFLLGLALYGLSADQKNRWYYLLIFATSYLTIILKMESLIAITSTVTSVVIYFSDNLEKRLGTFARSFGKLGEWSYSLYLIHVPIGVYLIRGLQIKVFGLETTDMLIRIVADTTIVAVLIGISWMMFKFIERPSIELARIIWKRERN